MRLKSLKHINDYIHKPQRESAPKLQKLFNQDSTPFPIPTARELIIERLTWFKWFEMEYNDRYPFSEFEETQELCKLINVDWEDLDVSVIDEYLDNKLQRCLNGERLIFKDFKLKH